MLKSVASTVVLVAMIVVLTSAVSVAFRLYCLTEQARRGIRDFSFSGRSRH